jgi:nuclear pore complex protein Nup160
MVSSAILQQETKLTIIGITVSPEEVVGLLVERNMFDLALSAASTMKVDMTNIFTTIATKCVELSRVSDERG